MKPEYESEEIIGANHDPLQQTLTEIENEIKGIRTSTLAHFRNLGKRGKSLTLQQLLEEMGTVAGRFIPLKRKLLLVTMPSTQGIIGKKEKDTYERAINEKAQEIDHLRSDITVKEGELPTVEEPVSELEKKLLYAPLVILLTEVLMETSSFQVFAIAWIACVAVAIGLSVGKWMIVKAVDKRLRLTVRRWKQVAWVLGTLGFGFMVGYLLGIFRNAFLESTGVVVRYGSIGFAFLSTAILAMAMGAEYILRRLRARVAMQRRRDAIMAELKSMNERLEQKEGELQRLRTEMDDVLAARVQTMERNDRYLDGIEDAFVDTARQAVSRYKLYSGGRENGTTVDFGQVTLPNIVEPQDFSPLRTNRK